MDLHDFICPEVLPKRSLEELSALALDKYPSDALMVTDVDSATVVLPDRRLSFDGIRQPEDLGGRAPLRNFQALETLKAHTTRGPAVTDFGDARSIDFEIFFGKPTNIFQFNRRTGNRHAVLARLPGYFTPGEELGQMQEAGFQDRVPFADKIARVYWRGAPSGYHWAAPIRRTNIKLGSVAPLPFDTLVAMSRKYSRIAAVLMSLQAPDLFDFKFAGNIEGIDLNPEIAHLFSERVDNTTITQHKYVLCPMGTDVSTQLYWIVGTQSLAFKEDCAYECIPDYFLKPWVHYVPIERGLFDLREKLDFCNRNQMLCRKIIDNANQAYRAMRSEKTWHEAEMKVFDRLGLRAP